MMYDDEEVGGWRLWQPIRLVIRRSDNTPCLAFSPIAIVVCALVAAVIAWLT